MIECKCQACGKFLKLPQSYAGKMTECPACRKPTRVPGSSAEPAPVHAPKSTTPDRQLCVDCGGAFPSHQMMEHTGQMVCTGCYHKRKPVVLKYKKKRSKKRKWLVRLLILIVLIVIVWLAWGWIFG